MTARPTYATRGTRSALRSPGLLAIAACSLALTAGCKKGDEDPEQSAATITDMEAEAGADSEAPESPEQSVDQEGPRDQATVEAAIAANEALIAQGLAVAPPETIPRAWDERELRDLRGRIGLEPPPPFDVASLLRKVDVRELTGFTGVLEDATLEGVIVGPRHNAIRYATEVDGTAGFGFSLEVRTFAAEQRNEAFYIEYSSSLIAGAPYAGAGVPAALSVFAGIRQLVAYRESPPATISISCQEDLCNTEQITAILSRVLRRF